MPGAVLSGLLSLNVVPFLSQTLKVSDIRLEVEQCHDVGGTGEAEESQASSQKRTL